MEVFVTAVLSFAVFALVIGGMALGVMAGRQPIKGSCGGASGKGCELCSNRGSCRKAQ
jgi:hypothetical protein